MRQPGAFDNVLGGIDAIAHTASPFHLHADDPNGGYHPQLINDFPLTPVPDIIVPAVNGTKNILETAVKNGYVPLINSNQLVVQPSYPKSSFVKRIVVTSSTVGIGFSPQAERPYSEEDWNEPALKAVRESGKEASGIAKYSASKTLAERGGSSFVLRPPVLTSVFQAAWEVYDGSKGSIGWDLTTLNPPYVSLQSAITLSHRPTSFV